MVLSASLPDYGSPGGAVEQPADAEPIKEREELITALSTGATSATLRLLVAVYALLTQADHHTLAPALWSQFLDGTDPRIVAPVSDIIVLPNNSLQCLSFRLVSY